MTKPYPPSLFQDEANVLLFYCLVESGVAWWSLVLEMASGQYTFSIFLRQVLWKLERLLVSCCVMRQHSEP